MVAIFASSPSRAGLDGDAQHSDKEFKCKRMSFELSEMFWLSTLVQINGTIATLSTCRPHDFRFEHKSTGH